MMVMEEASSPGVGSPERSLDFTFAFDNANFSDRILVIEITDNPESTPPDNRSNRKRRRRDDLLDNAIERAMEQGHQISNCNMRDLEKTVGMIEQPVMDVDISTKQSCQEADRDNEASPGRDCLPVRVKTIHVNSLILAAKSPFFYKLFSNGMRKSERQHVTLRIKASEEVSFMDLLNYMYSNNLPRSSLFALLDLLVTADKFEVDSCLRHCSRLLQNLPMTCESALLFLDLPSSLLMPHMIQPLVDAAKQFLAAHFKDIGRSREEVLNLPLAGIEAVLSSDGLEVDSEYAVYALAQMWARKHYPELEERRRIWKTHLLRLVRFPFISQAGLKKVLASDDIDPESTCKIVLDALFVNAASRAYKLRPIKVIGFEFPHQQCIVYLDLKREEVMHVFPDGRFGSWTFNLGGHTLGLWGKCTLDQQGHVHFFGLFLVMKMVKSVAATVNCEMASRMKPSKEFVSMWSGSHTFMGDIPSGKNLFHVPWTDLIADDSPYFINGILHLRADLTIKND